MLLSEISQKFFYNLDILYKMPVCDPIILDLILSLEYSNRTTIIDFNVSSDYLPYYKLISQKYYKTWVEQEGILLSVTYDPLKDYQHSSQTDTVSNNTGSSNSDVDEVRSVKAYNSTAMLENEEDVTKSINSNINDGTVTVKSVNSGYNSNSFNSTDKYLSFKDKYKLDEIVIQDTLKLICLHIYT